LSSVTSSPAGSSTTRDARVHESLSQTIDVETPELVVFSYTIAGVGSRALAALIDSLICIAAIISTSLLFAFAPRQSRTPSSPGVFDAWAAAIFVFAIFCLLWGYYVLFEGLADGQTPGKRLLRLRVVRDGGYSVTFGASAVRNLVRLIDIQPIPTYAIGILSVLFSKSGKRLGDIVAGTIVVREGLVKQLAPVTPAQAASEAPAPLHTALTEEEFVVLERFMERRGTLDPDRRTALAAQLAARLAGPLGAASETGRADGSRDLSKLVRLFESERQARARGVAARQERGAARERNVIVATRSPRWNAFAATLADAQRRGLGALGEDGVRAFVAEYRDLASDLARLRTAAHGRDTPEQFYLSRLLAGAHNLLYRGRTVSLADVVRVIAIEAPREVRRSWRPILLAGVLLFGPALIAYSAVVRQPAVAATFIPSTMLDRAEEGVRRAREGTGYIRDPQLFRPTMASMIIANNVQVTFGVFALGITAGLGSLLLLVLNGVSLGGVMGLYQSKGILTLLLAFVAPHGVLELTAVCIAGGAGFLLAAALLLPGRRTRRRALVENGRRAIRLVAAATVLLLVAGTLEGFVSPIPWWPLEAKFAVSGATLVLLIVYLRAGRGAPPLPPVPPIDSTAPDEHPELLALH
jgi:uncharacterized membrane protein SpoIIM required for sporulation/uncharacterized RDD family membrane protein YckC